MSPLPRTATEPEGGRMTRAGRSRSGSAPGAGDRFAASKSPREGAAVDEDVLTRDEAPVRAGEEGAKRPKFVRIAKPTDRDSGLRIRARRADAYIPLRRGALNATFLPFVFKRSSR